MSSTILIVDDDTLSRRLIRMVLEYDGHDCLEADDGTTALSLIYQQPVDVMILDHIMPTVTGLEVLRALHQSAQPVKPATIMITGLPESSIRDQARHFGVLAILSKPYDLGKLRNLVTRNGRAPTASRPSCTFRPQTELPPSL